MIVSFRNFMNTSLSYLNNQYTYNESNIDDLFDIYKKFYLVSIKKFKRLNQFFSCFEYFLDSTRSSSNEKRASEKYDY